MSNEKPQITPSFSGDAVSPFTIELFGALARDGFSIAAWRRFFKTSWERSSTFRHTHHSLRHSFYRWAIGSGFLGVLFLIWAWHTSPGIGLLVPLAAFTGWYSIVYGWSAVHLILIRDVAGNAYDSFLIPNGLTLIRLVLTPLVLYLEYVEVLSPSSRIALFFIIGFIAFSDLLDGILARTLAQQSRFGQVSDPLADLVLLSVLAFYLYRQDVMAAWLFALIFMRYPGIFVGGLIMTFIRGPRAMGTSLLGKGTTMVSFVIMVCLTLAVLIHPLWVSSLWIQGALYFLAALIVVNLAYLFFVALSWDR